MGIEESDVKRYSAIVKRTAAFLHRKFPMAERDDIEQECWMWFVTHPNKVREWSQLEYREANNLIAVSLRHAGLKYCIAEKARVEKYTTDDLFWYSADFIKELLPSVLSEDWKRVDAKLDGGPASGKSPAESGDWMAYAVDIIRAYESLSDDERTLVKRFYADDIGSDALQAESERPTARAAAMAANRAVHKMVRFLGGTNPFRPDNDIVEKSEENEEEKEDHDNS